MKDRVSIPYVQIIFKIQQRSPQIVQDVKEDKKQVPNPSPASSGQINYLGKRLSEEDHEMDSMFGEDRQIDGQVTVETISINIRHFIFHKLLICICHDVIWLKGYSLDSRNIRILFNYIRANSKVTKQDLSSLEFCLITT